MLFILRGKSNKLVFQSMSEKYFQNIFEISISRACEIS